MADIVEIVDKLLSLLREDEATRWVAEQLSLTFTEGLSMNVKEALADDRFSAIAAVDVVKRDRRKRDKYETTRPYTDEEKLQLLREALRTLFTVLPAVQEACLLRVRDLGVDVSAIEFAPPTEAGQAGASFAMSEATVTARRPELIARLSDFEKVLLA